MLLPSQAPADFAAQLQLLLEAGELKQEEFDATQPPREMPRAWLTMVDQLGKGNFGEVWKGLLNDRSNAAVPEYLVAAKTVLGSGTASVQEGRDDLMQEATVMARVGYHENLVSIIGVITRGDPWTIIVSFCEHGDIGGVLRRAAANGEPWWESTKVQICHEIACGMIHLTTSHIVHRDLAARNVLMTSTKVRESLAICNCSLLPLLPLSLRWYTSCAVCGRVPLTCSSFFCRLPRWLTSDSVATLPTTLRTTRSTTGPPRACFLVR